jgi:phosphopantothenate---cysteine ligase (CTP)
MRRPSVVVTCGPSYEPLDEVRRLTNFSTGELGVVLSEEMARRGWRVFCFKGIGAVHSDPVPAGGCRVEHFTTNSDLWGRLQRFASRSRADAIYHTAALCDFRVDRIEAELGRRVGGRKLSSRSGALVVRLTPAVKLLSRLRGLFPAALIIGWKYELAGGRPSALRAARAQLADARTDGCVVNGAAYGTGFGFCASGAVDVRHFGNKRELAHFLAQDLERRLGRVTTPGAG